MSESQHIQVDPHGDVVLVCGSPEEKVEIGVSSAVMITGSPVFKCMLSPRFVEGKALTTSGFTEIPLPDDHSKHVATMCNVLHNRNRAVPQFLEPAEIVEVAQSVRLLRIHRAYGCVLDSQTHRHSR